MRSQSPVIILSVAFRKAPSTWRRPFDGVEVWAVGRTEHHCRADSLDQFPCCRSFVAGQIIEDDNVTWFQCWNQYLSDIRIEPLTLDGAIDDNWSDHSYATKPRNQCGRLAMIVRKCVSSARQHPRLNKKSTFEIAISAVAFVYLGKKIVNVLMSLKCELWYQRALSQGSA